MKKTLEYSVITLFLLTIAFFLLVRGLTSDIYLQSYANDKAESSVSAAVVEDTSEIKPADEATSFDTSLSSEIELLEYAIQRIKLSYVEEIENKEIFEGALKGLLSSLDPHSAYLTEKEFKEMEIQTKGEFGGLGIVVTKDGSFIKVVSPIDDTPAAKAGVMAGDYISEIDGKNTFDMSLTDAVELMRGKIGERIKIVVLRRGEKKPLEFSLRREKIKIDSVKSEIIANDILYIRISNFTGNTYKDTVTAINKHKKDKINGIVLDLRNNPGGLLDQSIKVSGIFLGGDKTVVSIKGKNKDFVEEYKTNGGKPLISDVPIVVLVNDGSASASEIVAGALQDYKIAVIMGEKTFGKASVQQIFPLYNGGAIKLTIARYYTPLGRSIQLNGIEPDIIVKKAEVVYDTDNLEIREKDLDRHLENEDIVTETIKTMKNEKENITDYQLLRAVDFIDGINFYRKK